MSDNTPYPQDFDGVVEGDLHQLDGPTDRMPDQPDPVEESLLARAEARKKRQPLAQPRQPRSGDGPAPRRTKELVGALEGLRKAKPQRGGRWGQGCCPAHEDDNPSLGWRVMDDGTVMLNCKAGCPKEGILSALGGFTLRDLFPTDSSVSRYGKARLFAYEDQHGDLWLKSRDFAKGKHDGIKTELGFPTDEVLPYGSGWLKATDDSVVVVEGERDAHTLKEMDIPVLALPGAGWRATGRALNLFVGRRVWLWHDRDDPGVRAMDALAESVREAAVSIRVVRLTSLPGGAKDVSDVYAAGGADEVVRVLGLAEPWESSRADGEPGEGKVDDVVGEGGMFRSLDDRLDELEALGPVPFLVDGWIVASGLTFWAGHPKSGKTLALLQMLAGYVAGEPWMGSGVIGGDSVRVGIYVSKEGSRHEYVERGRNLQRHFPAIVGSGRFLDRFLEPISFTDGWLTEARKALAELESRFSVMGGQLRVLMVLDPLRDLMPDGADENSAKDMNIVKRWCRLLINEFDFLSIVVVHHLRKSAEGSTGLEMSGSGAGYGAVDGTVIWKSSKTKAAEAALNDEGDERLVSVRKLEGSFEVETKGEEAFGGKWEYDGAERWMQQPGVAERQEDRVVAAVARLGPGAHSVAAIAVESGLKDPRKTRVVCNRADQNKRLLRVGSGFAGVATSVTKEGNNVGSEMAAIFDPDGGNNEGEQTLGLVLDERESEGNNEGNND